jgi:hypothetical protein
MKHTWEAMNAHKILTGELEGKRWPREGRPIACYIRVRLRELRQFVSHLFCISKCVRSVRDLLGCDCDCVRLRDAG